MPLYLKEATKIRHVSRVSLSGGIVESALHKSMELMPGSPRRAQNVRGARVLVYLLRRADKTEGNLANRNKCVADNKDEQSWRPKCFDIRHRDAQIRVCSGAF